MADTYSNIHLHIIFAVKYRNAMLDSSWREDLFRYIGGVIKKSGHMTVMIGGYIDHIHILISASKNLNLPKLVKDIKLASNFWIKPKCKCNFKWQKGYGCFAVSYSHVQAVAKYISHQEQHHSSIGMLDEFRRLFEKNGIDYNDEYFFQDPD